MTITNLIENTLISNLKNLYDLEIASARKMDQVNLAKSDMATAGDKFCGHHNDNAITLLNAILKTKPITRTDKDIQQSLEFEYSSNIEDDGLFSDCEFKLSA